jgi:ribonuclease G
VQVTKEPIGTKGPRLTAQVSLPGRFLVYMPFSTHVGVSRKIDQRDERARLRELAREILPDGAGGGHHPHRGRGTHRRSSSGVRAPPRPVEEDPEAVDLVAGLPARIHSEAHLISGVIRDLFSDQFDAPQSSTSRTPTTRSSSTSRSVDPELLDRVELYQDRTPLFDRHDIEEEIAEAFGRRVDPHREGTSSSNPPRRSFPSM